MALYLLESSLCWLLFYGFYALTLSRETFFQLNRWYLLSTLAFGAVIPLLEVPLEWVMQTPEISLSAWLPIAEIGGTHEIVVSPSPAKPSLFQTLIMPAYWLGVAFAGLRFLLGLSQIFRLYFKGQKIRHAAYTLVLTEPGRLPFSFGRWLFMSRDNGFSDAETEKIIRHELAHIRGRHTLDVLLMEIVCILLWWSPAVYLYRRSLRTVHEYLADHAVLRMARRKEYGHLLIRQAQSGMQPALANHFFHSQLKKRIKMMTKTKSGKTALVKYLTVFPMLVLAMLLFANREALAQVSIITQQPAEATADLNEPPTGKLPADLTAPSLFGLDTDKEQSGNQEPLYFINGIPATKAEVEMLNPNEIESLEVLKSEEGVRVKGPKGEKGMVLIKTKKALGDPDEMPLFPGCEEIDLQARRDCAQKKLSEFIVANLTYPKSAQDAKLEGYVIASFVVNADGSIGKTEIISKSFCKACEEEVQRVIDLMPRWVPAQKDGKAVAAKVNLPIKFAPDAKFSESPITSDPVFKVVEEMPRFPGAGCENSELAPAAKQECAAKAMLEFIYQNLKYPKEAREAGTEGMVVVSFVVDQTGKIRDANIIRGIGKGANEEVLRLVGEMPDWIPGKQRGQAVNVQFNLPIKFKLDAPAPKSEENAKPQAQPVYPVKEGNWEPDKFSASPNPASNQVRVYFETEADAVYVCISDMANKLIFDENIAGFNGVYDKTFNVAGVPKGIVKILIIREGKDIYLHKLLVQ